MKPNHSGTIRIASNYARLVSTCVIGLFVVRMLLRFGDQAFGLIALLGTGTGLALVLKEVVRTSTVPVLGEAFHSRQPRWFEEVFNSALFCSALAGVFTLAIFGIFALCLPLLQFPQELYSAALIFVAASAIQSLVTIVIAPWFNFYVVSERMVAYNSFLFAERLGDILAVSLTLVVVGVGDASMAVIVYGISVATMSSLVNIAAAVIIIRADRRLMPRASHITKRAIKTFLNSAGWNSCVIVAMNLYARVDMVIMNLFFGLFGNMVFSLANQSVAYMRQLIIGLVAGVDAVASRMSHTDGDAAIIKLISRSTSLQAMVVFPTMLILLMFAEPLVGLWLAGRFDDPDRTITAICWLMRILVIGIGARCLSEGWIWIMNGAGKVKSYAPYVLIGGVLNPLLAVTALYVAPDSIRFVAPAIVFSILLFCVHLLIIPLIVAREYKLEFLSVIQPMFRPAGTSVICLLFAFVTTAGMQDSSLKPVAMGGLFVAAYGISGFFLLLPPEDRSRILGLIEKILPRTKRGTS